MTLGSEVRRDVGGVLVERDRLGEVDLLPARSGLVGEGGAGQQLPVRCPEVADVGPGVAGRLVEADPGDVAERVDLELDADLGRRRVTGVRRLRDDGRSPDRAGAAHGHRGAGRRRLDVAAVVDRPRPDRRGRAAVRDPGVAPGDCGGVPIVVAGCQVVPPSVETSTPATTPPPVSVAVPLIVTDEPSARSAPAPAR